MAIRVINSDVDSHLYQYLWDHHSINLTRWPASRRINNCKLQTKDLYCHFTDAFLPCGTFARHGGAERRTDVHFSVKTGVM
ncbi:hypothetical protein KCP74_10245 [Salmonella enterica subsp. enterica]|nr:hypothetical protein KCP74_10245 [Salmonella enterica subsp. enterica]